MLANYYIKLLAAILMVIDHVGVVFFPEDYSFRAIGRLSFPLFAWLLVQGEAYTRSVQRYALRLLILGLVSQPIYLLTFQTQNLNILFTLLVGLLCLRTARMFPQFQWLIWLAGGILAQVINVDYGGYGIAVIALLGQFQPVERWWLFWLLFHVLLLATFPDYGSFQFPAVFAPLIIQFAVQVANHQQGGKALWFYLFYPLHLLALGLISEML